MLKGKSLQLNHIEWHIKRYIDKKPHILRLQHLEFEENREVLRFYDRKVEEIKKLLNKNNPERPIFQMI